MVLKKLLLVMLLKLVEMAIQWKVRTIFARVVEGQERAEPAARFIITTIVIIVVNVIINIIVFII